jgi:hypothetical protein
MKRTVLVILAGAAFAAVGSAAIAQQDPINSAPSYSAPPAAGASTSSKITDGINGAPNYNATTAAGTAPKQRAASKPVGTQQHAHHRKHHTHAS